MQKKLTAGVLTKLLTLLDYVLVKDGMKFISDVIVAFYWNSSWLVDTVSLQFSISLP